MIAWVAEKAEQIIIRMTLVLLISAFIGGLLIGAIVHAFTA